MSARNETDALRQRIANGLGQSMYLSFENANTLRRAEKTLHRWAEMECGDENGCIERDEKTGKPFYCNANHSYLDPHDPRARYAVPDREKGALKRIARVCQLSGLKFWHQTDPRGCALYVSGDVLTESNYPHGVACC